MQNNLIFCSFYSSTSQLIYINVVVALNILCMTLAIASPTAASQCTWDYSGKSNSITCHLKALDQTTNLDWQPAQDYDKLRIQCDEKLLYESELPKNAFAQLRNLNELTIDSCKLQRLASDSLTGLKGLKRLTIRTRNGEWSQTKSLDLNVSSLHTLKELEVLNLIDSNLRTIPEGAFCELPTLQVLNITRNRIRSTDNLGFSQKPCVAGGEGELRVLDLSRNELTTLPENWSVSKLRRLQQLNLEHNNITDISGEALAGLPSLRIFNISYNQLEALPNGLFAGARDFQEIHLQHNRFLKYRAVYFISWNNC